MWKLFSLMTLCNDDTVVIKNKKELPVIIILKHVLLFSGVVCVAGRLNGRRSRDETELRTPERTNANTKRT